MNVLIRTDASIEIGTGHVMRCVTLAKQLIRNGAAVTFICRNLEGNSIQYIQSQNLHVIELPSINKNCSESDIQWIKNHWMIDAEETKTAIKSLNREIHLLIVDHYGIDIRWENELREKVKKIMVIDDLANRKHDCDLLLDQNYYLNMEKRYLGLIPEHCIQLLGPNYILLRDEFIEAACHYSTNLIRSGEIRRILVFFGGTDPTGETLKALKAIKELKLNHIHVDVIVGASNPKKQQIEKFASQVPTNVSFYSQVNNMAEFMAKADLAIGACGTTTWERCFLGLPSLTVIVADNQREVAKAVNEKGAACCLGESNQVTVKMITDVMDVLVQNPELVKKMSILCGEIINHQMVKNKPVFKNILEIV